ncbi:MAG: TPRREGION domain-containing protein [Nitrospira sp.]|nr:MAG: TPRREGION domain-containing protein [Nitrospira sp.]
MTYPVIALWLVLGVALIGEQASAGTPVQRLTAESMHECSLGRQAQTRAERIQHFALGQAFGEQAVAADESSPDAHFALFCNLGEQLRVDGESLSSLFGFRRMMKELNRTLELAPDHLDALSAKGTVLVRVPGFMGGDKEQGELLLRQVIAREPAAVNARLSLAKSYCADGRHEEAVAIATKALDLAQELQRVDFIPEARQVLAQLRAQSAKGN